MIAVLLGLFTLCAGMVIGYAFGLADAESGVQCNARRSGGYSAIGPTPENRRPPKGGSALRMGNPGGQRAAERGRMEVVDPKRPGWLAGDERGEAG